MYMQCRCCITTANVDAAPNTKAEIADEDEDDELYDPSKDLDLSGTGTGTGTGSSSGAAAAAGPDIEKVQPSQAMQNCTLAVVYAPALATAAAGGADAIRGAAVAGFVYVADVDEKRRRLRVLAPVSARLGDRPLVWGPWPEPMVSLLG